MTAYPSVVRRGRYRASCFLVAGGMALAGCGVGERAPEDPVEAQIFRLTQQGFTIAVDGRGSGGPIALQFQGSPSAVVTCQPEGGRASASDLAGAAPSPDGRYTVTQTGEAAAYVIVLPTAGLRGLYVVSVVRTVASSDGLVVARQIEKIEFPPGGSARFRNGVTCEPTA